MNTTQTDKQFALIVEDFYDDDDAVNYPISYKSSSDVFCRKLALLIAVAMASIIAFAFFIQNPITIPAAIIAAVAVIVYRNMVKDYAKKNKA
jgi:hypothetical protein